MPQMAKKKARRLNTQNHGTATGKPDQIRRDIMRKDKGLNGDLDRLPLLTWIMFLKFLDDLEKLEEARGRHRRQEVPVRPSKRPIAGATGPRTRTASPAMN